MWPSWHVVNAVGKRDIDEVIDEFVNAVNFPRDLPSSFYSVDYE